MSTPSSTSSTPSTLSSTPWRDLHRELFAEQGLGTVFTHARNLITGTWIVAAGMFAAHHPSQAHTFATWSVHFAGGVAVAVGALLLLLNLCDGLRSLAVRPRPRILRVATVVVYVGLSVRLVQVFMLIRLPM